MSGETKVSVSGWTIDTLAQHVDALTKAQDRFGTERDRRYTEVAVERDRALQIERTARAEALQLAREIQTYKDEKANELREQINSERGLYATKPELAALSEKLEAALKPVNEYIAADRGRGTGAQDNRAQIAWAVAIITSLIAIGSFVFGSSQQPEPAQAPQVIMVPAQPGTLLSSPPSSPQGAPR